jgi:hypothetical protein
MTKPLPPEDGLKIAWKRVQLNVSAEVIQHSIV